MTLLKATGLKVVYPGGHAALRGVDIDVPAGAVTAVIGESGSGKSTFARAALGMLPEGASIAGDVLFEGKSRLHSAPGRPSPGGRGIGYVPQDPVTNLDPLQRVGAAVREALRAVGEGSDEARVLGLLSAAGFPAPETVVRRFPHELSGGQRQRVLIALGLVGRPRLIVADEPTSALDVTVQKDVLDLLCRRATAEGAGLLLITHDIAIARERADQIIVLRDGQVLEHGTPAELGVHPYTKALLEASAHVATTRTRVAAAAPVVLSGTGLEKTYSGRGGAQTRALRQVSFELRRGETLGIVGQSGSGKSTLARAVLRLHKLDGGELIADGTLDVRRTRGAALRQYRRRVQPVFQNPYASLDPSYTIGGTLREAIRLGGGSSDSAARVRDLLALVGLQAEHAGRYPRALSGGQQQRVAIARALAFEPEVIVLDEAVSALDVVVQQRILDLLAKLQQELGVAYLFVSHDLAVMRQVAHRVIVMRDGGVVESGDTDQVFDAPRDAYTRRLLDAIPGGMPVGSADVEEHR